MARVALFVLPLIAAFVHKGDALNCWVCNSDSDPSCHDPFDTSANRRILTECDPSRYGSSRGHYVCRKYVKLVGEEKKKVVDRNCVSVSDQDHEGPCSAQSLGNPSQLESCHTCNTNECNSAPGLAIASVFTLLPTLLIAIKHF
ncbi:UPAR/Ly6 domain-containing protein crok [Halyomorpha halys]|uniref:UPAR/Ly6 domain-containing protein crok n=1 Tax=Halyomorpha halys TaxID=286706 RepID=UPI0006D51408|nr:uncharacterized protein LOC106677902 [Halyomorpha halys]